MCERDRLCDDQPSSIRPQDPPLEDDDDHGYHTPKNIFNAEMSRLSQLQLQLSSAYETSTTHNSDVEDEENPYSTIKKCPTRSTMMKNLETLIEKNTTATQQKSRSVFYKDVSMDNMLSELKQASLKKKLRLMERLGEIDRVDLALLICFFVLVIFGFSGFYILINEF
ncbi:unnamed protein product [Heligmosomoides polygyrus]|uniref:Miff domain-containing protein n=1 Tax=Heligmosomoides polygyrus TaxID=6339 RepID=A0A183FRT5_HELPZ|nr:unnamed protein product [Heligmosomoides polygyrus]